MLYVESEKVYSLKKRHISDTITLCARRALKACKQGDGIYCTTRVEVTLVNRVAHKEQVPVTMRKQAYGGWIIFPLFYKSPKYRHLYANKRKEGNVPAHKDKPSRS